MSQLLTINLSKGPGTSWGFRLQGGKDFAQPLCIQKVNVGSVAEAAGLQAGDAIVSIGGSDALALRHKEAQDAIVRAGNSFPLVVQRGAMTWKPHVTALSQPKKTPQGPVATQTSLAAARQPTKYNSPINLYNEDAVAEALSAQSEVLGKGCLGINFHKFDREVTLRTDSPTYQMIHGEESAAGAPKPRKQLPLQEDGPQQPKPVFPTPQPGQQGPGSGVSSPVPGGGPTRSVQAPVTRPRAEGDPHPAGGVTVCSQCEKPIIGVFVRIKDKNLHADCFKCNTCGSSLKNVGYYNINEKLYCDVHAKQAAKINPPGPNMVPVTVRPGGTPPAGAFPAAAAKAPVAAPAQQPEPAQPPPPAPEPAAAAAPPPAAPASPPPTETLPEVESPMVEEAAAVVHEAAGPLPPHEEVAPEVEAPVQEGGPAEVEPVAESAELPPAVEQEAEVAPEAQVTEEPVAPVEEPVVAVEQEGREAAPEEQQPEPVAEAPEAEQQAPVETEPEPEVALEPEPEPEVVLAPEPEPEILEAPAPAGAEFTQEEPVASVAFAQPAPIFAPAPAPIPSTQPSVAPGGSSANPTGFGAPSGGVNVRSHIPKKAARFVWPPRRAASEESHVSHSPSWAPVGEILKVPMPVHVAGPLPKTIPLLPTPPPAKDYESMVMSTVNVEELKRQQQQQQQVSQVVQRSSTATTQKTVVQTTFESKSSSSVSVSASSSSVSATNSSSLIGGAVDSSAGRSIIKGKISPPKPVPVTAPMPTVNFGPNISLPVNTKPLAVAAPTVSAQAQPQSALLPGGLKKSASVPGVKSVKAPVPLAKSSDPSSFGFKPVKPKFGAQQKPGTSAPAPAPAPAARTPIDPSTLPFAVPPLPFGSPLIDLAPAPAPAAPKKVAPTPTPKPAQKPTPKPASPQPPKPAGPVAPAPIAAPTYAPAPVYTPPKPVVAPVAAPAFNKPLAAPAPAPAPMFGGGGGMPKPAPPPGMGGLAKPPGMGGPPTKGIPGERTAPKRGRGVMNPAHASRIPVCANCQRQIRGPFVTALGKNWCPDHFHCATESCRKQLIDVGFVEEQGSLYCEDCYEKYLAPTCGKCDKRIKGDCLNAVGKQFHPECFACAYCGKVFGSGAFYLEDGLPYCETDWNDLFTTKCVGCGFPIEAGDRWVEALNNNYHSQCFKCSKCHKNLEGQSFFAKGGKPFCKAHAQRGF